MISVKVTYTVTQVFVEQNKQNISRFLTDFKKLVALGFMYNVYLQEDELTFVHISMYEEESVQQQILNVPSFIIFQKERDESGLTVAPKIEKLNLIGSSLGFLS